MISTLPPPMSTHTAGAGSSTRLARSAAIGLAVIAVALSVGHPRDCPERDNACRRFDEAIVPVFVGLPLGRRSNEHERCESQLSARELGDGERDVVDRSERDARNEDDRQPEARGQLRVRLAGPVGSEQAAGALDHEAVTAGAQGLGASREIHDVESDARSLGRGGGRGG